MNKGELEKKITEIFGLMYKGTQEIVYVNLGESMKAMIEEARREFPKQLYKDEKGYNRIRTAFEAMIKQQQWFEKWFGESDEG